MPISALPVEQLHGLAEQLRAAGDLAIANLAGYRSSPPERAGLDSQTYQRLFSRALNDAYVGLEHTGQPEVVYALLDSVSAALAERIHSSPTLRHALGDSGAYEAEAGLRAYVLATSLRALAPDSLSEFAAAVLRIPLASALALEPAVEAPSL